MDNRLENLFFQVTGHSVNSANQLTPAGSNRVYYRLSDSENNTLIGVEGTSVQENEAFFEISRHFFKQGLAVPQLIAVSNDKLVYLIRDLGDTSLFDYLSADRNSGEYSAQSVAMLEKVMME